MFVFPAKWLPGLLTIGGIIMLLSGESIAFALVCTGVGAVWSYYKYFNK